MTIDPTFFDIGAGIAAASRGIGSGELVRRRAGDRVMSGPEGVPFRRELCKIAAAAFEADGTGGSAAAHLFRNLADAPVWHASYDRFTDSVTRALSKEGGLLLSGAAAAHDKLGGGVMKNLLAGGALAGTTIGSLAFLLSRNARQSSADSAQLLEKVRAYKQLRRDIEEDMGGDLGGGSPLAGEGGERFDV